MSATRAVYPAPGPIDAHIRPPGSKSGTIRALVLAAVATGASKLAHPLDSDDTRFARAALTDLGIAIDDDGEIWSIAGGGGRFIRSTADLDAGASGLTARALIAISPLVDGSTTVVGRERLPERPMGPLTAALRSMGILVDDDDGRLPVRVTGRGAIPGGRVEVDSSESSQFATALLMSAALAESPMTVAPIGLIGSAGYLQMTAELMGIFGSSVEERDGMWATPNDGYTGIEVAIEPDASAAVYPMVAAAITGGRVIIEGLGSASLQPDLEVADVLGEMGCRVLVEPDSVTVSGDSGLSGVDRDLSAAPDGALAVAVACLFATGPSRLGGLGSLRFKESDRLAALSTEMRRLGAGTVVDGDDLLIDPGPIRATVVETYHDHRIAMSLGLVGLVVPGIEVSDPGVVAKTWPGYWEMLDGLANTGS